MTAPNELVLTPEEATVIADLDGEDGFPSVPLPVLKTPAWQAVVRGMRARGLLHGVLRYRPTSDVESLVRVVLHPQRTLLFNSIFRQGAGHNDGYGLYLRDDQTVRLTERADGALRLCACDRSVVDELLAYTLDLPEQTVSVRGEATTTNISEFAEAMKLEESDGPAAAAERYPNIGGYMAAIADARRSATVFSRRALPGDVEEEETVNLVDSERYGLWVSHDQPSTDRTENVTVVLQQVTVDDARELMTRFIAAGP